MVSPARLLPSTSVCHWAFYGQIWLLFQPAWTICCPSVICSHAVCPVIPVQPSDQPISTLVKPLVIIEMVILGTHQTVTKVWPCGPSFWCLWCWELLDGYCFWMFSKGIIHRVLQITSVIWAYISGILIEYRICRITVQLFFQPDRFNLRCIDRGLAVGI